MFLFYGNRDDCSSKFGWIAMLSWIWGKLYLRVFWTAKLIILEMCWSCIQVISLDRSTIKLLKFNLHHVCRSSPSGLGLQIYLVQHIVQSSFSDFGLFVTLIAARILWVPCLEEIPLVKKPNLSIVKYGTVWDGWGCLSRMDLCCFCPILKILFRRPLAWCCGGLNKCDTSLQHIGTSKGYLICMVVKRGNYKGGAGGSISDWCL